MDPRLVAFLALVLVLVPLVGQLYPKVVPFLTAFRPYAGNWRFTWHIVDNKHRHKLRKLKVCERISLLPLAVQCEGLHQLFKFHQLFPRYPCISPQIAIILT